MSKQKKKAESGGCATSDSFPKRLFRMFVDLLQGWVKILLVLSCCLWAYRIRLLSVETYGYVIHGADPTFNWHATRYMAKKGWYEFFRWYDYQAWYPLGRPVGTTIYPGMQIVSVGIYRLLKMFPKTTWQIPEGILAILPRYMVQYLPGHGVFSFGSMSLNNVCVMTGSWFGALATLFTALLTAETSGSSGAGVVAAFIMAGIPAHQMRSMSGQYDNESIAMALFCGTFWLWCRALRTPSSWPWAILAAGLYACAVATWGGYIFVNNMIGLHAAVIVALGMYNTGVYRAYTTWYTLGTLGATFVPVVGWMPLKSLEQMPAMLVFLAFQLLELCDTYRRRQKKQMTPWRFFFFRVSVFVAAAAFASLVCVILFQFNYFSPLSSRIRGIFLKHKRTGNPLVDSVSEHQPTRPESYQRLLGDARHLAVAGLAFCWHQRTPAKFFPVLYAIVAYTFSLKMSRLMVICGPIVSILAGYPIGILFDWCSEQCLRLICGPRPEPEVKPLPERTGGMGSFYSAFSRHFTKEVKDILDRKDKVATETPLVDRGMRMLAVLLFAFTIPMVRVSGQEFVKYCEGSAPGFAHPGLVFRAQTRDGGIIIVDDILKGYEWLKANTPEDSRVLSWWDYGYQITGIGNRTSLADGNTWNHEHIATLGRILSGQEKKSYNIMRHLADYALVHVGPQEKDLGISRHFARIGNSVFPDICGEKDPTCDKYGFLGDGKPSKMMGESFVYKAVKHGNGASLNPKFFQEVHNTERGYIRIYKILNISQTSKDWVADPANKVCDAPGSWYCVGQYPPALEKLIAKRKNFAQLEDFNRKTQEKSAYTKLIEERQKKGMSEL